MPMSEARLRVAPLPRFVLIERGGGRVFGDTADLLFRDLPKRLTPIKAAVMIQSLICDYYPYKYRRVRRGDPAACLTVYRVAPDYPKGMGPADIARDCKYVATLARIYPTCCFCGGPMKYAEESLWLYGFRAHPLAEGQCCATCYDSKVRPAQEAEFRADGG